MSVKTLQKYLVNLSLIFLVTNSIAYAEIGPQDLVKDTTEKMLAALKKERKVLEAKPELIYDLVNEIVLPHFDFISMSRWVLAKNWSKASREQKLRFVRAFRTLLVRTYAIALLDYTDQKIIFLPLRDDVATKDVVVRTEVHQDAGQTIQINYSLHLKKKGWKVYDVSVDGVSLIANFRTSFATEIRQKDIEALITRLEEHNKKAEMAGNKSE